MRLLIAEDDDELRRDLHALLSKRGDIAETTADGAEALFLAQSEPWDAIVLDLGLPELDGLDILKTLRGDGIVTPVLVLSARDTWNDKVVGLRSGADDYMTKPFFPEELIARIEALVRRASGRASAEIEIGDICIDPSRKIATFKGRVIPLTAFEFRALEYLGRNAGHVISQDVLSQHIYAQSVDLSSNVIEVLIARIRKKTAPDVIKTVRGHGYKIPTDDA